MYGLVVMNTLFDSRKVHSYNEIKRFCKSKLGVSENQIKGIVGALVRNERIYLIKHATKNKSAIFAR